MSNSYEVIIIGGSYAGLSAGMTLGRALRRTLIIDGGEPCNRYAPASHNFITHDGEAPGTIADAARRQVLAYATVALVRDRAVELSGEDGKFSVTTTAGERYGAKKLLFATGLHDGLPDIPGMQECWGKSVVHCPYCHGYEIREQPTGILMNGEHTVNMVQLIRNWTSDLTLFTNGPAAFDPADLEACEVRIVQEPVRELLHEGGQLTGVALASGTQEAITALYLHPELRQKCPLPEEAGCELTEHGMLHVDEFDMTSVTGIYAAGDCTTRMRTVSFATGAGTRAGAMINHALVMEHFGVKHVGG
ncbi:NAD(P)/FAD-dependent oxidoreductase [Lewinella sp. IMCC34183]|uniref:NAD(P)/FAD-dependent oxidoreductase n=1 Tax=Lewinella sp. IMCC34183 TaxID=2248762 RepID=UPI000E26CD14|nr:NAD(P)/FAD-dependent oxidoreductase [Lewinella sp. IMCC34183]